MASDRKFPIGFNWQCSNPNCGIFASVAVPDLDNYVCPECRGGIELRDLQKRPNVVMQSNWRDLTKMETDNKAKAVVVPGTTKIEAGPLQFKDPRFEVRVKNLKKKSELTKRGRKKKTTTVIAKNTQE